MLFRCFLLVQLCAVSLIAGCGSDEPTVIQAPPQTQAEIDAYDEEIRRDQMGDQR